MPSKIVPIQAVEGKNGSYEHFHIIADVILKFIVYKATEMDEDKLSFQPWAFVWQEIKIGQG